MSARHATKISRPEWPSCCRSKRCEGSAASARHRLGERPGNRKRGGGLKMFQGIRGAAAAPAKRGWVLATTPPNVSTEIDAGRSATCDIRATLPEFVQNHPLVLTVRIKVVRRSSQQSRGERTGYRIGGGTRGERSGRRWQSWVVTRRQRRPRGTAQNLTRYLRTDTAQQMHGTVIGSSRSEAQGGARLGPSG